MGFDGSLSIGYTLFRSAFLSSPVGIKYRINDNTYLGLIKTSSCCEMIGNILLIPGGAGVANSYPYYVSLTSEHTAENVRLFIFEKKTPVANISVIHDVEDAVKFLKSHFSGPVVLMGYSLGGLVLFSYLSFGYDSCDFYIPVCCTIDSVKFENCILSHPIFRQILDKACKEYNVQSHRDLIKIGGCPLSHDKYLSLLVKRFNSRDHRDKLFYIISSDDPLTQPINGCTSLFKFQPYTHIIVGGWHCCIKTIYFATRIAHRYLLRRSKGEIPVPSSLDY